MYQIYQRMGFDLLMFVTNFIVSMVIASCATNLKSRPQQISAGPIHENILMIEPSLNKFAGRGPFEVIQKMDREVTLDLDQSVVVDHFAARSRDKLPIVVISHGNFSGKKAHRAQSELLASWGFHVVAFEAPNRDQWIQNGARLKKFTDLIHRLPTVLGENANQDRIIVVGHSFGGSASVLAMGAGAPVIGAVLLDPAVVHSSVVDAMKNVSQPVVLLGSDKKVFIARGRGRFSKNIGGEILEISVVGATHDDAQGPSMFSRSSLGVDPFTSSNKQDVFRSMLTAAVIGIASSGTLDFPSKIYSRAASNGTIRDFFYREAIR